MTVPLSKPRLGLVTQLLDGSDVQNSDREQEGNHYRRYANEAEGGLQEREDVIHRETERRTSCPEPRYSKEDRVRHDVDARHHECLTAERTRIFSDDEVERRQRSKKRCEHQHASEAIVTEAQDRCAYQHERQDTPAIEPQF